MTDKEQPNYYAIIPANVRYDKMLKANEKLMYGEITCLSKSTGECFASNRYFAELYGVSKETISRWINNLKKHGYIDVIITYKKGSKIIDKRVITLLTKKSIPYCEKNQYPIDENIKDNNTRDNNTRNKKTTSIYEDFLTQLKYACKYKSKVTKTKEGEKLFKQIQDKKKLFRDYIQHQKDKENFAVRITKYLEDYNTVYSRETTKQEPISEIDYWGGM